MGARFIVHPYNFIKMLCITLKGLNQLCTGVSGGMIRCWIFDPLDFDWTQAPAVAGVAQVYTAVALVATATTGKMYRINFTEKTGKWSYTQSRNGCSVKYEHQIEFALPDLNQEITTWNQVVDAAGCCCGLGVVIQLNTARIFVAGEKVVNAAAIEVPMKVVQDGSTGDSGTNLDDPNQQLTILKGDYGRSLYEYTGGAQSIINLE